MVWIFINFILVVSILFEKNFIFVIIFDIKSVLKSKLVVKFDFYCLFGILIV